MTQPLQPVYHLALRDLHRSLGAVFTVAHRWSLPNHYGDPAAEYAALRRGTVFFDSSDRSRILVTGTDAHVVLGEAFAGHVEELEEGRSMRAAALDERGLVRDVALIARTGGIAYLLIGEPGQRFETLARLRAAVGEGFDARIEDRTETTCLLAVAGPGAGDVARMHFSEGLPPTVLPLQCTTFLFHGFRGLAIRTSSIGEDGFELMLAPAVAQHLIETLRTAGIPAAGRLALESARVESCIPAFDPDLTPGLSPAEADLDTLLDIPGGAESRILSALLFEAAEPVAPGTPLFAGDREVGVVRSCLRSFGLNGTIGLGIINGHDARPGLELMAGPSPAAVVAKPFYRRRSPS